MDEAGAFELHAAVVEVVVADWTTHNITCCSESLRSAGAGFTFRCARLTRHFYPWEARMTWKAPKIVEVPVGMEINMYACAARK